MAHLISPFQAIGNATAQWFKSLADAGRPPEEKYAGAYQAIEAYSTNKFGAWGNFSQSSYQPPEEYKFRTFSDSFGNFVPGGSNTRKLESPGSNTTKVDSPGSNTTKVDSPGSNTRKVDSPGSKTTKVDSPGSNTTKIDSPGSNTTKVDSPASNKQEKKGNETKK